jgi:uncharacterized surface protein with fasciclin (FAS1) repeats
MRIPGIAKAVTVGLLVAASGAPVLSATPKEPTRPAGDIIASLKSAGRFTTLLSLIETAGMTATLQGTGPFTLFAPTDSAFAALPPAKLGVLKEKTSAAAIVNFYVVPGMVMAAEFKSRADAQSYATFKTMGGADIKVHMARHVGKEFATLVQADMMASNGVIHAVDKVMMP